MDTHNLAIKVTSAGQKSQTFYLKKTQYKIEMLGIFIALRNKYQNIFTK